MAEAIAPARNNATNGLLVVDEARPSHRRVIVENQNAAMVA
jgi:hypothetical protein